MIEPVTGQLYLLPPLCFYLFSSSFTLVFDLLLWSLANRTVGNWTLKYVCPIDLISAYLNLPVIYISSTANLAHAPVACTDTCCRG